ncbi:MAG TPA: L-serine ammonia-lyase [Candidatus Aminicenantes bacterium]|nr:L-serine ammonia-lyase [Candidatus Aminicenantes bacterium]HPB55352.1 L-serine ammonia-lyase [Candidatus Aminicenantes bacterium]HPT00092.1 L-serine ammonia-lyase [Candidatus Aminicenantes bacterium]
MALGSVFEILKIGVGPSSSHTLGPAQAGLHFRGLRPCWDGEQDLRLKVSLYGSLALTGKGHLTDVAVTAGLGGYDPEKTPGSPLRLFHETEERGFLTFPREARVSFSPSHDIVYDTEREDLLHPNTLRIDLFSQGTLIESGEYLSVGGGVLEGNRICLSSSRRGSAGLASMGEVMAVCEREEEDLVAFILEHERLVAGKEPFQVYARLQRLWEIMQESIHRGVSTRGVLPGELKLVRKAPELMSRFHKKIVEWKILSQVITLGSIYAIAVAEENASGARLVTAPTCGSAGVVPAVLKILEDRFHYSQERILQALLIAGLIGALVKHNASISGAEIGCQGEVGTASAMAAAAASFLLGGTLSQIESAAETALEHHLGLTCDPVKGLVQIPCIERNAVGAVTALNAANLSLLTSGKHRISFDTVVETMQQVGRDMNRKYKETALGGLATLYRSVGEDDPLGSA